MELLREIAGLNKEGAGLANEILVLSDQHAKGELTTEEYKFLLQEIADVRAQRDLAGNELIRNQIINACMTLGSVL